MAATARPLLLVLVCVAVAAASDSNDTSVPEDVLLGRGEREGAFRYCIGDVVENMRPGLRGAVGVVAERFRSFPGTDDWFKRNVPSGLNRNQPFYRILVSEFTYHSGVRMPPGFVRLNAQSTLRKVVPGDPLFEPVKHEMLDAVFKALDSSGKYVPRGSKLNDLGCTAVPSADDHATAPEVVPRLIARSLARRQDRETGEDEDAWLEELVNGDRATS
eukprot:TRINITY_DN4732_c1_g1_i1.p1 TRINITY_DN4732_c1_g1~~TRINITY_DN4732_c1_g1_i1.p1  ORF type:complete len:217 (+),score=11.33 TRINITY_DN4732_c1_g1_i1:99-749(+)